MVHRDTDKGTVFLSVFDLSDHLFFSLTVCLPVLGTPSAGYGDMEL